MLGNLQTLTVNKDAVFDLARLALTKPRFDADATERVRAQILAGLKFDEHDPEKVASLAWDRLAFQGHPYGRPVKGTLQSIAAISRDDLKSYVDRMFARDKLVISVVGDIDAASSASRWTMFSARCPRGRSSPRWPTPIRRSARRKRSSRWTCRNRWRVSAMRGIAAQGPGLHAAFVLNHVIGGGGFSSRLMEEVREKRGLAYSVHSNLYPYEHARSSSAAWRPRTRRSASRSR